LIGAYVGETTAKGNATRQPNLEHQTLAMVVAQPGGMMRDPS
jgi:hypothetical protein